MAVGGLAVGVILGGLDVVLDLVARHDCCGLGMDWNGIVNQMEDGRGTVYGIYVQ